MNSLPSNKSYANEINAIIKKFNDWRGERLAQIRVLIKVADPGVIEEVKWKKPSNPDGIPVWSHDGIICTGETYKNHLRLSFAKGPILKDPKGLLNSYRAIIIREVDKINQAAFKDLIREAVELNQKNKKK